MTHRTHRFSRSFTAAALVALMVVAFARPAGAATDAASSGLLSSKDSAVDARQLPGPRRRPSRRVTSPSKLPRQLGPHAVIPNFMYLITQDDTGGADLTNPACRAGTNSNYPQGCDWASIASTPAGTAGEVITQGDQSDFAGGKTLHLPGGKYLISVTSQGHKIDGTHFTVDGNSTVNVQMNAVPLRTATLRARIFDDKASTNGELDEPAETVTQNCAGSVCTPSEDMSGFRVEDRRCP